MNDVVLAALFSSAGAALVAVAGAIASIFGPAWREAAQRRHEVEAAREDARYDRALSFVEKLLSQPSASYWHDTVELYAARSRFVATLRPGDAAVETYTSKMVDLARSSDLAAPKRVEQLSVAIDRLFEWLRGDVNESALRDLPELK